MQNFEFSVPTKIFFGEGQLDHIGNAILKHSDKILLAYGGGSIKKNGIYNQVVQQLEKYGISYEELSGIQPNPRIESVREGVQLCRKHELGFILGVGGGSVVDCIKAIAAGVDYDGDPWDFFMGKAKVESALPLGSVLTLSATGSEMNGNSVISNDDLKLKLPIGHEILKPQFSVLDPVYTYTVPADQTAAGTADIMSHCFEQYFSDVKETYVQDRMTEAMLKTCIEYGPVAIHEPENYTARANLMWASSLALNGLLTYGKKGDWATHWIEHTLSAHFDMTHGTGLAIITPHWMEYVLDESTVERFANIAYHLWHIEWKDPFEMARAGIEKTREFFRKIGIPSNLKEAGIELNESLIDRMAEDAVIFGDLGNLKKLGKGDIKEILKAIQ